jgi:hypothetical protein
MSDAASEVVPPQVDPKTETLVVPAAVTVLTLDSFVDAQLVEKVTFEKGSRIRRLETSTFYWCRSLKSIVIAASVEVIERDCFVGSTQGRQPSFLMPCRLETVTFEAGSKLREIESGAFTGCNQLRSLSIPRSVMRMSWASFISSLEVQIRLEPGNPYFERRRDFLVDIRRHVLVRYLGTASEVVIPDEIKEIGESCFDSCVTIQSMRFGRKSRLTSIQRSAFESCTHLTGITIPSTVRFMGE